MPSALDDSSQMQRCGFQSNWGQSVICLCQGLPHYIFHFVKRFATGSYASTHQRAVPASLTASALDPLARDAFGFRQVIVAANDLGKIYGLDSSNGAVLWSRMLGLGWAAQVGAQIVPVKLFVVQAVADGGFPEVVLVAQRRANNVLFLPPDLARG